MTPPPRPGTRVTATTKRGTKVTGKVDRLTPASVTIGGQTILRRNLAAWKLAYLEPTP